MLSIFFSEGSLTSLTIRALHACVAHIAHEPATSARPSPAGSSLTIRVSINDMRVELCAIQSQSALAGPIGYADPIASAADSPANSARLSLVQPWSRSA